METQRKAIEPVRIAAIIAVLVLAVSVAWLIWRNAADKSAASGAEFERRVIDSQRALATTVQKGWHVVTGTSEMDDTDEVQFQLNAEAPIQTWHGMQYPRLIVSCNGTRLSTYVVTNIPARANSEIDFHTVRVRIDDRRPTREGWQNSTDGEALFSPHGAALAKELLSAQQMLFEFIPSESNPEVVTFKVAGLGSLAKVTENGCNLH